MDSMEIFAFIFLCNGILKSKNNTALIPSIDTTATDEILEVQTMLWSALHLVQPLESKRNWKTFLDFCFHGTCSLVHQLRNIAWEKVGRDTGRYILIPRSSKQTFSLSRHKAQHPSTRTVHPHDQPLQTVQPPPQHNSQPHET